MCGYSSTIAPMKISYSTTSYNGKLKTPALQIQGMIQGFDYTVSYYNNKKPGKGQMKITFIDHIQCPTVITFNITPAKPSNLKTTSKSKTNVTFSWDKAVGASKYIVYQYSDKTGKYAKIATVTVNKATIKNLKANTAYKFCVKSVGSAGTSGYSEKLAVKTKK